MVFELIQGTADGAEIKDRITTASSLAHGTGILSLVEQSRISINTLADQKAHDMIIGHVDIDHIEQECLDVGSDDVAVVQQSSRRSVQLLHGTCKESHKIRKAGPVVGVSPQRSAQTHIVEGIYKQRGPVIIHTYSPKAIHAEGPAHFMWLVQSLTGSSDTRHRCLHSRPCAAGGCSCRPDALIINNQPPPHELTRSPPSSPPATAATSFTCSTSSSTDDVDRPLRRCRAMSTSSSCCRSANSSNSGTQVGQKSSPAHHLYHHDDHTSRDSTTQYLHSRTTSNFDPHRQLSSFSVDALRSIPPAPEFDSFECSSMATADHLSNLPRPPNSVVARKTNLISPPTLISTPLQQYTPAAAQVTPATAAYRKYSKPVDSASSCTLSSTSSDLLDLRPPAGAASPSSHLQLQQELPSDDPDEAAAADPQGESDHDHSACVDRYTAQVSHTHLSINLDPAQYPDDLDVWPSFNFFDHGREYFDRGVISPMISHSPPSSTRTLDGSPLEQLSFGAILCAEFDDGSY